MPKWIGIPRRSFGADRGLSDEPAGCVIAEQDAGVAFNVGAQFVDAAGGCVAAGCGDVVVQRCVKPVGVAGQPVAKEGQQFAEFDRVGAAQTEEGGPSALP